MATHRFVLHGNGERLTIDLADDAEPQHTLEQFAEQMRQSQVVDLPTGAGEARVNMALVWAVEYRPPAPKPALRRGR